MVMMQTLIGSYSSATTAASLALSRTNVTTADLETQTADGTVISAASDQIILDGWNQRYQDGPGDQGTNINLNANNGTLTVSGGEITVDVQVWGAAGGSAGRTSTYENKGGGAEYRKARIVLKPGTFYYIVGGGGGAGNESQGDTGEGGWGGGAGGGVGTASGDGTAFGNGGDGYNGSTANLLGGGGGGCSGLFAGSPAQGTAILVAGGGGGAGGYESSGNTTRYGLPGGGSGDSRYGTSSSGGSGEQNARDGGAGFGGAGGRNGTGTATRSGGGGGGGYWGGGGGDRYYTRAKQGGGGGMGYTASSNGHALIGTVSATVTEQGLYSSSTSTSGRPGGYSAANKGTYTGESTGVYQDNGCGGRLVITVV